MCLLLTSTRVMKSIILRGCRQRQRCKFKLLLGTNTSTPTVFLFERSWYNLDRPQKLELTAMEESIVLDHLDVFKLNGFDIRPSPDGVGIYLHTIAMSGNTIFTLSDLEELIHLVQLHPDRKSVRCSRARAMFAMRACRSSIMIGRALSQKMMEQVVRNLGGLDKPWSCPHGRPTMRHLTELDGWSSWDRDLVSLEDE